MPSCCCGWLRTAAGSRVEALSHVGQVRRGPMQVWLVSQSLHRSQLQASQERLQSCTARRDPPGLLETGQACFAAFTCLLVLPSLACMYQYRSREGAAAGATCTWPAPRCVINTSSRVACQPWLQAVGTLGNARRYKAGYPPRPYLLLWLLLTPAFLFSSLLFSSHTSSHPLLLLLYLSIGFSSPAYFPFTLKAS